MINKIEFNEFIKNCNITIPEKNKFQNLGKKLGLHTRDNDIIELNFNRSPLLYTIISKYRPKNILEFGTGGGFGTMSMAWAMTENKIDGTIFTVDLLDNNDSWSRAIDWNDGKGPKIEEISNNDLWTKLIPLDWREKVKTVSGYSGQVMTKNKFPMIDFAYIDGAHFYAGVQHDFFAFLKNSNETFAVLFDDYIDIPAYGVKDFIDKEVSKWFDVELIFTDPEKHLFNKEITKNKEYGMCWIHSNTMKIPKEEIINSMKSEVKKYISFEKRMILRNKINKKIPFLKNHRLSWWKN